jgi:hypothetical protein
MYADSQFDEVVLFELPANDYAQRLWLRLQGTRLAWLHRRDDSLFVAVALRAEADDLARLLRDVETWVADCALAYVPFELDGRRYELRARGELVAQNAA